MRLLTIASADARKWLASCDSDWSINVAVQQRNKRPRESMKNHRTGWISVGAILILFLIAVGAYSLLAGRTLFVSDKSTREKFQTAVEMAKTRVSVGDSRDSALTSLSDAWFHTECRLTPTGPIDDLFFYGSNEPDAVEVVVLTSHDENGVLAVTFVGMIENYMLHLYDHCVPLPASAFSDS
jgi:hypothetical protein